MNIELFSLIQILYRRRWLLVILTVLVVVLSALLFPYLSKPEYRATAKVVLVSNSNNSELTMEKMNLNISLINTLKELIKTPSVIGTIISKYPAWGETVDSLVESITISTIEQTPVMSITIKHASDKYIVEMLSAVIDMLKQQGSNIYKTGNVLLFDEFELGKIVPEYKNYALRNVIIVDFVVFLFTCITIIIFELRNNWIHNMHQLAELGMSPLGAIETVKRSDLLSRHKSELIWKGEESHLTISM